MQLRKNVAHNADRAGKNSKIRKFRKPQYLTNMRLSIQLRSKHDARVSVIGTNQHHENGGKHANVDPNRCTRMNSDSIEPGAACKCAMGLYLGGSSVSPTNQILPLLSTRGCFPPRVANEKYCCLHLYPVLDNLKIHAFWRTHCSRCTVLPNRRWQHTNFEPRWHSQDRSTPHMLRDSAMRKRPHFRQQIPC